MKMMYVYILECSDHSFYTGVTNDIDRRFEEHQSGENKEAYTYSRRPVKLVYSEFFIDPTDAINFEKQIKGWTRKKKIALINGDFKALVRLSNHNKNND
jgi:putative endonuclease